MRRLTDWFIDTPVMAGLLALLLLGAGLYTAPFTDASLPAAVADLPRDPVPVDALPDIGENQQIVFTRWSGHSPQDVEDQITYPLATLLLGLPGVRTVRAYSYFGYASVFLIFDDSVPFYWSRSRLLEKLSALPQGTLPEGVVPELGPDATGLGQVFWYSVEADAPGVFDLHALRAVQDWTLKPALQAVPGVAEVAGIGGQVEEWLVEVNPDALRHHGVALSQLAAAVRAANLDVGARTFEVNRVEYVVRGVGKLATLADLSAVVVAAGDHVPLTLADVAHITKGPAPRRGVLDRGGAEVVGGVVVVRVGADARAVIQQVKRVLAELAPALPQQQGARVVVRPFYDRTALIDETVQTLQDALIDEVLVTILVIVLMLGELRASLLVSVSLPLGVLAVFVAMRVTGVGANIMSLAGIAIAIGTMVDVGVILAENTVRHLGLAPPDEPVAAVVKRATGEVAGAVFAAVATTVLGFLPVFALSGREARLFGPLAWTKTYALVAAIAVTLLVVPPAAAILFRRARPGPVARALWIAALAIAAAGALWLGAPWAAAGLATLALARAASPWLPPAGQIWLRRALVAVMMAVVAGLLAHHWQPMGPGAGFWAQALFVVIAVGGVVGGFHLFLRGFERILRFWLRHKLLFAALPLSLVLAGLAVWRGPQDLPPAWQPAVAEVFPGLPTDFMPPFDEGSFLWMPTTMPHASLGEALEVLQLQDRAIASVPEVSSVVGKIGRVDSALDPAPISMIETVIQYHPEYGPPDPDTGERPRLWRDHIRSPEDIWAEIATAAALPGTTSAPQLMPIAARMVMLQSGMRAPMGVKVRGRTLADIEQIAGEVEALLGAVEGVAPGTVIADRVVGKPYLEIQIDRAAIARYGLTVDAVNGVIEVALGGRTVTTVIDGRARHAVRVRYPRERRTALESIGEIVVPTPQGAQVPLAQLADVRFTRGPMVIKSEDGFLVGYVTFGAARGETPAAVVARAQVALDAAVADGRLPLPPGAGFRFAGEFENQVRVERTLRVVLPLALLLIFGVLYLQFRRVSTSLLVFSGIAVAWAGGFVLLGLYGSEGFLALPLGDHTLAEVLNVGPQTLTVAVWVGFLALFGVASDDGVVVATYLEQQRAVQQPTTVAALREVVVTAAGRRVRPCLMTTATTLLALLPVLTSDGRGADVMGPMALPILGGMTFALLTLFVVPVGWCGWQEIRLRWAPADAAT